MQGEKDPDDFVRERGIHEFRSLLSGSLPIWDVLWERETASAKVDTPDGQAALEQKLRTIVRTVKDSVVQTAYERTCRMQLASLFWQVEKRRRGDDGGRSAKKGSIKSELKIEREGRQHGLQKILLGMLVHFPDFLEDKSIKIAKSEIHFSTQLEDFRQALFDLLIVHREISVQFIYARLKPAFYEVLQDIHGERTEQHASGYQLFRRFPILKSDPPRDYISQCIDLFVDYLHIEQIHDDIEALSLEIETAVEDEGGSYDRATARLIELVKQYQLLRDEATIRDTKLAEEARDLKRVWGAAYGMAA